MIGVKTGEKTFKVGQGCQYRKWDWPVHNPRPTTERGKRRKPGNRPKNFEYGN